MNSTSANCANRLSGIYHMCNSTHTQKWASDTVKEPVVTVQTDCQKSITYATPSKNGHQI